MVKLSAAIGRVQPSPTIAAANRAEALKASGRDIISLTVGEPDFDTPQHIKDAAAEAMRRGYTKYTAVGGIGTLKTVISEKLRRDQKVEYSPQEIIVTNGGKQALATACAVLLGPGDEAIVPSPYWTSYPDMVRLAGAEPVIVETLPENGYVLQPEALRRACSGRTRMLILNSPNNPAGGGYTREDLLALVDALRAAGYLENLTILTDEVYEYITFDGFEHVSIATVAPELREQIVIVNAFSKAYSMTGWRVGYAAAPKRIIDAMATHESQFTSNVCSIAQHAAAAAYTDNYAFPKMMAKAFSERLNLVCTAIEQMPGIRLAAKPRGSFFVFPRLEGIFGKRYAGKAISSGLDFTNYLLEQHNVAVVQGEAFGDPGAIRISFALDEQSLTRATDRIGTAIRALA